MTFAHGSRSALAARSTLRSLTLASLLAGFGAGFVACGGGGASQGGAASPDSSGGGGASAGTAAADFSARDIEGKTVHLSDYLGRQAILMDFWSTYCEPCLAEMPHLRKMY